MALRRSVATRMRVSQAKRASWRSPCAYPCGVIIGERSLHNKGKAAASADSIFAGCAVLAVAECAIDSFLHQPMANFLVKRFTDLMLVCVSTIGGLLAGQKIEGRKHLPPK